MTFNQPTSLNCPACEAPLDVDGTSPVVRCNFCCNTSLLPNTHPSQAAGPVGAMADIQRLAAAGNLPAAIERYRQAYGVDEQEARAVVETLQGGRQATASAPGMRPPEELTRALEDVQRLLKAGDKIGAIKVYREYFDVGLERAKYAVEQIEAGQTFQPETGFQALNRPMQVSQPIRRSGSRAGGIIITVILLFVAVLVAFILFRSSAGIGRHYNPETPLVLVPSGPAAVPQIAGFFYNPDADTRSIGLVDPATGKLLWQAAKLSGDGNPEAVATGPDLIYVANATDLLAYHKSDGSLAWQVRMSDKLNYGVSNLLVTAGRVITSNVDQTSNLDADSALIYDPAGHALYLVYDSSYGCVQRLDLASGITVWEADSQNNFSLTPDDFQALLTASTLYFNNGNDLMAVDKSSGSMKVLLTNPDYELLPLAVAGDNLIVRARRTRGTEIFQLWGVDTSSGSQVWQVDMQGSSPIDPPNEMSGLIDNTDFGWTWRLASTGLVVCTFQGQPNQLVLETFNPASGTSLGKKAIPLNNISGDFYDIPTVLSWQGNVAYLSLDLNIYSLDVTTGQLKVIY